jgi:hypothetical protein
MTQRECVNGDLIRLNSEELQRLQYQHSQIRQTSGINVRACHYWEKPRLLP